MATAERGETGGKLWVSYPSPDQFCDAYRRDLAYGALFVPTTDPPARGTVVSVTLHFAFSAGQVEFEAEVVTVVPAAMASTGAKPGVAVRLQEPVSELRQRLEDATVLLLPAVDELPPDSRRGAARFAARAIVVLEVDGRHYPAETVDVSYNGMLALLPGVDLGEGTEARAVLMHPGSGEELTLEARVVNQTRCEHGVMAVGVEFRYAMDRVDAVTEFLDRLRAFHVAEKLASVAGSLSETPLEVVMETFSSASNAGTLVLKGGDDEGKIVYRDGEILSATTGLVSGIKAVGRMFTWTDASFEFYPRIEPIDGDAEPIPLHSVILAAAVERDELARLPLVGLDPNSTFSVHEERLTAVKAELGELRCAIAENAGMGFPLAALLDILTASDASVMKALADLLEAGVLSFE